MLKHGVDYIDISSYNLKLIMIYIALFRGINVGGHKKIKMADLKLLFIEFGFNNVITYIQSGNVIFESNEPNKANINEKLRCAIADKYGFDVDIIILTKDEMTKAFNCNPFTKTEKYEIEKLYFCFLENTPNELSINSFIDKYSDLENIYYLNNVFYIEYLNRYSDSKINNNFIESKLKTNTTTRNYKTINEIIKLLEK